MKKFCEFKSAEEQNFQQRTDESVDKHLDSEL